MNDQYAQLPEAKTGLKQVVAATGIFLAVIICAAIFAFAVNANAWL